MTTLIITHANCYDGFVAGWLAHRHAIRNGYEATIHFASHGSPPPNTVGKNVLLFDFCYPRKELEKMEADADSLMVYDHHRSAQAECGDLSYCHFDMDKSGAMLAANYFEEADDFPFLVADYVEDRDLWIHELPDSKEIVSVLYSWPMDFAFWDAKAENPPTGDDLAYQGRALKQLDDTMVENICKNAYTVELEPGVRVPSINVYVDRVSNVLNRLLEIYPNSPYSVGWYMDKKGVYRYSLRSTDDRNYDVSELATSFGGGGHKLASGFASQTHLI